MNIEMFIGRIRNSFTGSEYVFTSGSCYQLFVIVLALFPTCSAYTNGDHVLIENDGVFYDINGIVEDIQGYKHYNYTKDELHKTTFSMWSCGLECPNCDDIIEYSHLINQS
ncbi:MAG: hypothetical protein DRH97_00070 [Chloroflexi bacterium]|nr:MAG: hypothetical protein DRH97_00070 [Chloroflexota bacterium]